MGKSNSKLNPEQLGDLKFNTQFSDSEIKEWYKAFMMDFPSGQLNRTQFKVLYSNLFPNGDESRFVEHAFRTFDADGDGFVDFLPVVNQEVVDALPLVLRVLHLLHTR